MRPDLGGKRFILASNTGGAAVAGETHFAIEQNGSAVRISYSGGGIRLGAMIGEFETDNRLAVRFQQIKSETGFASGRATLTVSRGADGLLEVLDSWVYETGREGSGTAAWREVGSAGDVQG